MLKRIDEASGKKNVTGPRRTVKSPGSRNSGKPAMTSRPRSTSTAPPTTSTLPIRFLSVLGDYPSVNQFHTGKKIADLEGGRFRRVRPVRGILAD